MSGWCPICDSNPCKFSDANSSNKRDNTDSQTENNELSAVRRFKTSGRKTKNDKPLKDLPTKSDDKNSENEKLSKAAIVAFGIKSALGVVKKCSYKPDMQTQSYNNEAFNDQAVDYNQQRIEQEGISHLEVGYCPSIEPFPGNLPTYVQPPPKINLQFLPPSRSYLWYTLKCYEKSQPETEKTKLIPKKNPNAPGEKPPNAGEEQSTSGGKPPKQNKNSKNNEPPQPPPRSGINYTNMVDKATNHLATVDVGLDVLDALADDKPDPKKIVGNSLKFVGGIMESKNFKHGGKCAAVGKAIGLLSNIKNKSVSDLSWRDAVPVGRCVGDILSQQYPIAGIANNIATIALGDFQWPELPGYVADTLLKTATMSMPQVKGLIFGLKVAKLGANAISTGLKATKVIPKLVGRAVSSVKSFFSSLKFW